MVKPKGKCCGGLAPDAQKCLVEWAVVPKSVFVDPQIFLYEP